MKYMGVWSWNELPTWWQGIRIVVPVNDHQGDMPYCLHMGWAQKQLLICTEYLTMREGWGKYMLLFYLFFILTNWVIWILLDIPLRKFPLMKSSHWFRPWLGANRYMYQSLPEPTTCMTKALDQNVSNMQHLSPAKVWKRENTSSFT